MVERDRRLALLEVSPEFLIQCCQEQAQLLRMARVVKHALPKDATFVRAGHDVTGALCLVLWSATFQSIPEGERLPMLPLPVFEVVTEGA